MQRRATLDMARVAAGFASLAAAIAVAIWARVEAELFSLLLAAGVVVFSAALVLVARGVTQRWIEYGARLGFAPAVRRPVLDLGTDRPVLYGKAGRHSARIRLVLTRGPRGPREWLEVETDLLLEKPDDSRALAARAHTAARELAPIARVQVRGGRLAMRAPLAAEEGARALVDGFARVADAVERG